jgi:hypothetical protein
MAFADAEENCEGAERENGFTRIARIAANLHGAQTCDLQQRNFPRRLLDNWELLIGNVAANHRLALKLSPSAYGWRTSIR